MSQLGSIYEEPDSEKARGPDLRVAVEVPRPVLGQAGGWAAPIPDAIDGVPRTKAPGDPAGAVRLHLPEAFKSGSVLRLRGQGGAVEGGVPGDLYLQVELVEPPPSRLRGPLLVVLVVALGAAAVWAFAS